MDREKFRRIIRRQTVNFIFIFVISLSLEFALRSMIPASVGVALQICNGISTQIQMHYLVRTESDA
jgi:hypothetical protein